MAIGQNMNFLFDIAQEGRIRSAQREADGAREKAGDALASTVDLKQRVDVMALANQALFEILKGRLGITEEDVLQRMAEIDRGDGSNDGKMTPRVVACGKCGRKVSTARLRCVFCGAAVKDGHLFEKA